ncbi:MAG: hypothetical protein PVF58_10565 [Candidatus Methanofastidiosia archaeon]|jgi:hypothetical protein
MKKCIILFITILVTGCVQPSNEIEFLDYSEDLACIAPEKVPKEVVITSDEEYEALLKYMSDSPVCMGSYLPLIDFSQYVLLGKYASGSGCTVTFEKHVYTDTDNKRVIYSITVVEEGLCEMFVMSMNWIVIPKFPGYDIVFEVE